jgi:hypothetical protein
VRDLRKATTPCPPRLCGGGVSDPCTEFEPTRVVGDEITVKRTGGPAPKLQQQVERLSQLPQAQQRIVMEMLEGFLNQTAKNC